MNKKEISEDTIFEIAEYINNRVTQTPKVSVTSDENCTTSPQYFEIVSFDKIDQSENKFFAIDGSYNSQEFYNGISVGLYTAGYICYEKGKQIRVNDLDDPVILGKTYYPKNILITNEKDRYAVFNELLELEPVKKLLTFFAEENKDLIWSFKKELVCSSISKLLSFCQEVLEWSLLLEVIQSNKSVSGDIILRDGALRSVSIKQKYLVKIAYLAKQKGVYIVAITKNSAIKLELSSSFNKIDEYLEKDKKPSYPFTIKEKHWQKLCCWFEVGDDILLGSYPEASGNNTRYSMFANKNLKSGRGFGLFFAARLDYVEKLQNYDWMVVDINILDAMPNIDNSKSEQDIAKLDRDFGYLRKIFKELTRLTQEHYILGYPYPLVEVHNFVTLKNNFKEDVINRVKASLYKSQYMDHVDIENMFIDLHGRF